MVSIDGVLRSRSMNKEDFENIKISALNFEQARYCKLLNGTIDSEGKITNSTFRLFEIVSFFETVSSL